MKHSPSWLLPLLNFLGFFFPRNSPLLSSPLLVTNQSSLTKSTFNPSLGPLVLPDGGGWVLAAVCDPTLINRVGEGKGAMHTPIHYLIRMAHSERWSTSLYLNDRGWTQHGVQHPFRLLLSTTTWIPSTCLFTLLHIKSHHFTQRSTAARKFQLMNSCTQRLVTLVHLELNNAQIIYSQMPCRAQHWVCLCVCVCVLSACVCARNLVLRGWKVSLVVWISPLFGVIERVIYLQVEIPAMFVFRHDSSPFLHVLVIRTHVLIWAQVPVEQKKFTQK